MGKIKEKDLTKLSELSKEDLIRIITKDGKSANINGKSLGESLLELIPIAASGDKGLAGDETININKDYRQFMNGDLNEIYDSGVFHLNGPLLNAPSVFSDKSVYGFVVSIVLTKGTNTHRIFQLLYDKNLDSFWYRISWTGSFISWKKFGA